MTIFLSFMLLGANVNFCFYFGQPALISYANCGLSMFVIVRLSEDLFERRASTGSGHFSFMGGSFAHIFGKSYP